MLSYEKALEINPTYSISWINKGYVLTILGRYEEAINSYFLLILSISLSYEKALQLNPKDYEGWSKKGSALNKLERYDEAMSWLISHYNNDNII